MRSLGELEDALAEDLAWRRTELHALLARIRENDGPLGLCMRRGGVALLYAHWEGYTKNALLSYWKYVAKKRLSYEELSYNFVALGLERELKRQTGTTSTERMLDRVSRLLDAQSSRALMHERDIDTRSNLNSEVLDDLLLRMGLDRSHFATRRHFIDYSLLSRRNSIAHGDYLDIDVAGYEEVHHEVLTLLNLLRNTVVNAASTGQFRRHPEVGMAASPAP